jgi:hypothetical protein
MMPLSRRMRPCPCPQVLCSCSTTTAVPRRAASQRAVRAATSLRSGRRRREHRRLSGSCSTGQRASARLSSRTGQRRKGEAERWCIPAANGARCRQNGTPRAMRRRARGRSATSQAQRARLRGRRREMHHRNSSCRRGTRRMSTVDAGPPWCQGASARSDRPLRSHASRCTSGIALQLPQTASE